MRMFADIVQGINEIVTSWITVYNSNRQSEQSLNNSRHLQSPETLEPHRWRGDYRR